MSRREGLAWALLVAALGNGLLMPHPWKTVIGVGQLVGMVIWDFRDPSPRPWTVGRKQ